MKSIPLDIEEAAMIDGCTPLQTYFQIVFPILKPTAITVAILNAMWVWNDYLLPYLVIGVSTKYKTIPVVSDGVLRSERLWILDGTACAVYYTDYYILFILPEVYH